MGSTKLGEDKTETHLLTHCEYNGMPEIFSYGSNETGVREILDGEIVDNSFRLIQHGWRDWKAAGEFIKKALAKGWDAGRIYTAMQYLKDRKNAPPKARTV